MRTSRRSVGLSRPHGVREAEEKPGPAGSVVLAKLAVVLAVVARPRAAVVVVVVAGEQAVAVLTAHADVGAIAGVFARDHAGVEALRRRAALLAGICGTIIAVDARHAEQVGGVASGGA